MGGIADPHVLQGSAGSDVDGLRDRIQQRDAAGDVARGRRRLGLPRKVSRFVLTVGATANQNGTALFEGVTVLFLAQFFGVRAAAWRSR